MAASIKKSAIIGYITIFVNIITGLLYTPWMIKQIGVSEYGLYTLISSFLSYFLLDFGLGTAVSRFVSKYREEGRAEEIDKLLSVIVKVFAIIDAAIFVLLIVCYFNIAEIFTGLTPDEQEKFRVIYCIAGGFSLLTFPFSYLNGILIAYERFVVLKSCELVQRILIVALVVLCLLTGHGLYSLVFVNSCVGLFIVIYKLLYLSRKENIRIDVRYFDKNTLLELLRFSAWVFVIGVASRLMYNIIPTVLGRYCNSTEVAKFSVAMMMEGYVYTFASALNGLFLPRVMRITLKTNDGDELTKLMITVGRIQLIIVGLIISAFVVVGRQFVNLWLGIDFDMSYFVTLCLITPGLISLTEEIGNTALIATNELKYRAFLYIGASAISVIGGYILAPQYGALGCGVAVLLSLIFCHILGMNILYYYKLHINVIKFLYNTIMPFVPVVCIPIVVTYALSNYINMGGWIEFLLVAALYSISFITVIWFLFMRSAERKMIKSIFNR